MAATTAPIFTQVPKIQWVQVSGVDGGTDGTDADVQLVFTADATDGSYIQKVIFQPRSTSGSTTTSAAAGRIYLNNGSTVGTATNNVLIREVTLPALAVNVAGTTGVMSTEVALNMQLPAGYRIYVGITAIAANTEYAVTGVGGDY